MNTEIFHKHYDESILSTMPNEDLLLLYGYLYKHELGDINEWRKIKKEIIQRMGGE